MLCTFVKKKLRCMNFLKMILLREELYIMIEDYIHFDVGIVTVQDF